jgi:hypothetical protein
MDLKNFYLNTPLDRPEYVRIKLADIPQEFIDKYKLNKIARNSWIYFEMRRGMYGLPQGIVANKLLQDRLAKFDYYKAATTTRLWCHKWHPIILHSLLKTLPSNMLVMSTWIIFAKLSKSTTSL